MNVYSVPQDIKQVDGLDATLPVRPMDPAGYECYECSSLLRRATTQERYLLEQHRILRLEPYERCQGRFGIEARQTRKLRPEDPDDERLFAQRRLELRKDWKGHGDHAAIAFGTAAGMIPPPGARRGTFAWRQRQYVALGLDKRLPS